MDFHQNYSSSPKVLISSLTKLQDAQFQLAHAEQRITSAHHMLEEEQALTLAGSYRRSHKSKYDVKEEAIAEAAKAARAAIGSNGRAFTSTIAARMTALAAAVAATAASREIALQSHVIYHHQHLSSSTLPQAEGQQIWWALQPCPLHG